MNSTVDEEYLIVPAERLSKEALDGLIEEFILREGTDYGHNDHTLEQKKSKVYTQLAAGHVIVVYSSLTENTSLLAKNQLNKL